MNNYQLVVPNGYIGLGYDYLLGSSHFQSAPIKGTWAISKHGTSNPGWEAKVAKGINAASAYDRKFGRLVQPGYCDFMVTKGNNYTRLYGWYTQSPLLSDNDGDVLTRDIAVTKIKKKISSDRADFEVMKDLIQDSMEFKRTIHGTLDTIEDMLTKVDRTLNRRRGRGARNGWIENLADLWLEFAFGIKPTLSDAKELAESIDAFLKRQDHTKRFQASHYNDMKGGRAQKGFISLPGLTLDYQEVSTRRYSVKYTTGIHYRVFSATDYAYFLRHFHFMPQDFIPTAWEWLPWTWLFDYVANVGDVLTDYFQSDANDSFYNIENRKEVQNNYGILTARANSGYSLVRNEMTPRLFEHGYFYRTSLGSLPHRIFRWRTPYEIERNLNKKLANIVAVLIGLSNANAKASARRR